MKKNLLFLAAALVSFAGYALDANKVYTISNYKSTSAYLQDNYYANDILGASYQDNGNVYWVFTPTDNENCYYIQNYKTGRYIQSHGTATEVAVTMGAEPAEYCVMAFDNEEGSYGFSSTNNENHNFTAGCVGLNLKAEPYENSDADPTFCCAQTFNAVAGANHRSFWKVTEVDLSTNAVKNVAFGGNKPLISSTRVANSFNINVADNGSFTWQLANINGQVVAKGKAKGEATVNTSAIAGGLYIVTINQNGARYTEKIIRL
jgi:hypothetical protein